MMWHVVKQACIIFIIPQMLHFQWNIVVWDINCTFHMEGGSNKIVNLWHDSKKPFLWEIQVIAPKDFTQPLALCKWQPIHTQCGILSQGVENQWDVILYCNIIWLVLHFMPWHCLVMRNMFHHFILCYLNRPDLWIWIFSSHPSIHPPTHPPTHPSWKGR